MPPGEGYYRSRIPCPEDERVARVVRAFSESSPGRQAVFREAVDGVRAGLLLVFSERMAALAVRLESARPIVPGPRSPRRWPRRATRARRSPCPPCTAAAPRSSGSTPPRLFDEAAGRTDLSGAHWLRDVRDAEDSPEDVGYERPTTARASATSAPSRASRAASGGLVGCRAVTEQPRDPSAHTEVHRVADPDATRVASLPGPARRGRARAAPVLGRPRHERDAQVDPGRVRGRGRRAHGQPRPAGRGLRRRQGQGAAARRARGARGRRARGVRARVRAAGDQGERRLRRRLPALHRARAGR